MTLACDGSLGFRPVGHLYDEQIAAIVGRLPYMEPWNTLGYGPDKLRSYLIGSNPDTQRFLIEVAGALSGLIVVRYPWLRGVYIELFAVFPEAQGRGVGAAALRYLEDRYGGKTSNLWLLVSSFNLGAKRFYTRQGFCPVGTIEGFAHPNNDEILMRKVLSADVR